MEVEAGDEASVTGPMTTGKMYTPPSRSHSRPAVDPTEFASPRAAPAPPTAAASPRSDQEGMPSYADAIKTASGTETATAIPPLAREGARPSATSC